MPSLTLEDNVTYYFEDSGAVTGDTYTTVVCIPGLSYNGAVFKRLFPFASSRKLRIVGLYRRDYAPTSEFHPSDLLDMGKPQEETFLRKQGVEIAKFLAAFARSEGIPPAGEQPGRGGIVLLGWSLGVIHAHAVLAYLDALPSETSEELGKYLHTVLLHDASTFIMGMPMPPWHDASIFAIPDAEERYKSFQAWVTGYYAHKNHLSPLEDRNELELNKASDKPHSLHDLSAKEFACISSFNAFNGSECGLLSISPEVHRTVTRRALFDKQLAGEFLPNLRVRYLTNGESPGVLLWSMWELNKYLEDPSPFGEGAEKARDTKTLCPAKGNHFVFWDEPELALSQYLQCINM
ncbi:hypothetical protein BV22DRAFT_1014330 [Leucogyrophana mollusca]|uniref:Uncharacterized protein n=1 Tax=Leucogyrophana mollusca TaxID=85980 RepID=A0ACB8BF98_9AGAM|nr:hypothetical protein BV22DRAFT_1014330 [Leucogyrophana mollusca]